MTNITGKSDNIAIDGHVGTWYVISTTYHNGREVYLLEHEEYGDEAAALIVDKTGRIIMDEVYNGFDDLNDL